MADNFKFVQASVATLSGAGVSAADTTMILTAFEDPDGNLLAMTDFGTIGFGTIEPDSSDRIESICFTGVTQNGNGTATLTGISTVSFKYPYTQTSGIAKSHPGGSKFVISNSPGLYDKMVSKSNDESITGLYTFTQLPVMSATATPTISTQLVPKLYVDQAVVAGASNADLTTKGIVEEATAAEIIAGTQTGGTGAELFINPKYLVDSTILIGKSGATTYDLTTASGTQNIAHGLGRVPRNVKITAILAPNTPTALMSFGVFDGTNNSSVFSVATSNAWTTIQVADSSTYGVYLLPNSTNNADKQVAVISADATNIILTWTKYQSPSGTAEILWEAI